MPRSDSRPRPRGALAEYARKRDFARTPEPAGEVPASGPATLEFVVQKHAARHLHFDLRLQMGGVMRSWAVPKGPSLDPSAKRLAVEVEDHPIQYNEFEGTIPRGEYGGGTVMLWDRGSYEPTDARRGEDPEVALQRGYRRGRIGFVLHGERLRGAFLLVRTGRDADRPHWLLVKQEDAHADLAADLEAFDTSVATGRTLAEISEGKGGKRVWRSGRSVRPRLPNPTPRTESSPGALSPMLASSGETPRGEDWTFEPKYDGIRVLAFAAPEAVSLMTRNGNDKSAQFPEVVAGLRALVAEVGESLVLDGELVGVRDGRVARFESLQGRMHLTDRGRVARLAESEPAALVAFDLLLRGAEIPLHDSWSRRREQLEAVLAGRESPTVLLGESSADAEAMRRRAAREGWEGLVAKRTGSPYQPGKRSRDWVKVKLENRQELVIGGWTEPRGGRKHLGAILLGYFEPGGDLVYAGHTGAGFSHAALEDVSRKLRRLERKTPPFRETPSTNETPHWATPRLVAEIRFNEWTQDGKLRQPVFLGLRTDRDPLSVIREPSGPPQKPEPKTRGERPPAPKGERAVARRVRALRSSPSEGGRLELGEASLEVTNLGKRFFPGSGHTKGDLMEYYALMAGLIRPWMRDRPLVLRRYPNGIDGKSFFQQTAPDDAPEGVRVEAVVFGGSRKKHVRLVGGDLATLLYTVQLGAVSYDPWHSRLGELDSPDYTILDLDPGPGTPFRTVVEVARRVREEMETLGLHGALKTSGSSGLHIYLPLPPRTPPDAATLVAQIVATRVAGRHPAIATVERMRKRRRSGTVYVDYLQNIVGKSVAGVYAVRAKPGATVSTPLAWEELTDDLDLREFTLDTLPRRVAAVGDLWAPAMREPNDLRSLLPGGAE